MRSPTVFAAALLALLASPAIGQVDIGGVLSTGDYGLAIDSIQWTFMTAPAPIMESIPGWEGSPGAFDTVLFTPRVEWPLTARLFYTFRVGGSGVELLMPIEPDTWYTLTVWNLSSIFASPRVMFLDTVGAAVETPQPGPLRARLSAGPNPSPHGAILDCNLSRPARIRLVVFDGTGRLIRNLARGEIASGPISFFWDGTDNAGRAVGAGIYFARLEADSVRMMAKLVLTGD